MDPDGSRIHISAKRSRILLAMLATSKSGERSRRWLQERIWGSRERTNSQASLRRELSNLRPLINVGGRSLLLVEHETVALDLSQVAIDVRDQRRVVESRGEFLEGIDIAWEEGFEDWLREERQAIEFAREASEEQASLLPAARPADDEGAAVTGNPTLGIVVHDEEMPAASAAAIDRIADMLAERIARLRWLHLVGAPAIKWKFDGPATMLRAGKTLGVDYLLHCQFNPDGSMTIALAQASTARMLWSERHDLGDEEASSDPARIANDAIAAISARIETDQADRVRERPVEQLGAGELLWRARWHMRRLNRHDAEIADQLLARAAREQPDSVDIILEQARADALRFYVTGGAPSDVETLRRRVMLARDIDPYDARAWLLLGILDLWSRQHDSAAALMHEAIRLEPSLSAAYGHLGSCYSFSGQPADGKRLVHNALRLSPIDTQTFHQFGQLSLANLMIGDYDQAVTDANAALARRPGYVQGHVYKVAALWMKGDGAGAAGAGELLFRTKPHFDPDALRRLPFRDSEWNRKLRTAIDLALADVRSPTDG